MTRSAEPPSGKQFEIRHGAQRAVVVEVGAGLRQYDYDGQPVLDGYAVDQMADGGRGQPLLPWPNRLADGQYEFGGQQLQLPIDELSRRNANHGLTRWLNWTPVNHAKDRVQLELVIHPRPGYPFTLQLQIEHSLEDAGLSVRTSARNLGDKALPFGAGQHPYFTVGTLTVNAASLRLPAGQRVELDAERRLPTGRLIDVQGTEYDFRAARSIGDTLLDDCFCDLQRDADGRARAVLTAPDRTRSVAIWVDQHYKYLQVFSGDTLAPDRRRRGLAIEPMTCPPNAFRSGIDVVVLPPGEAIDLAWGVEIDNRLTGS